MAVSGIGTAYNILYDYQSRTQGTEQENKQSERFSDALSADGKTVPYGAMAKDGIIEYKGVIFTCDYENNRICLGDVSDKNKCINIALSGGGSLVVNRENLGDLSRAIGMFSPEDVNLILRALARDKQIQKMQHEIDDMENGEEAQQVIREKMQEREPEQVREKAQETKPEQVREKVQDEEQGQARKQTSAIEADKESVLQSEPQIHDEDYFIRKMRERVKAYHERSSSAEVLDRGEIYRPQQQAERIREAAAYRAKEADKTPKQMDLFEENFLKREVKAEYTLIGQVFDTYWLVQFQDSLYIIDQHAAHERVMYERTLKEMKSREYTSQYLSPPIILSLSMQEAQLLEEHIDRFTRIGFEIEHFGGEEYAVRAVPDNLFGIAKKELLMEMIDDLADGINTSMTPDLIDEKVASMSCKAAVKGNNRLSAKEVDALIGELLTLDNPYHCPHGRPTIIAMRKRELEKKFKRIV